MANQGLLPIPFDIMEEGLECLYNQNPSTNKKTNKQTNYESSKGLNPQNNATVCIRPVGFPICRTNYIIYKAFIHFWP